MPSKPETKIVKKALEYLRSHGGKWTKIHGGPYQEVGLPDIIGCYEGRFYGLECKTPSAYKHVEMHLTQSQRCCLEEIHSNGGRVAVFCHIYQLGYYMGKWFDEDNDIVRGGPPRCVNPWGDAPRIPGPDINHSVMLSRGSFGLFSGE